MADATLRKDVSALVKRQRNARKRTAAAVDTLLARAREAHAALSDGGVTAADANRAIAQLKAQAGELDTLGRVKAEHKALHSAISKASKAIDKSLSVDLSPLAALGATAAAGGAAAAPEGPGTQPNQLAAPIADHLYRHGHVEVADALLRATSGDESAGGAGAAASPGSAAQRAATAASVSRAPYLAVHGILRDLRSGRLDSALEWAASQRAALRALGSTLEFDLHCLAFIRLLTRRGAPGDGRRAALEHARRHFSAFTDGSGGRLASIRRLMAAMLYAERPGGLEASPYADLVAPGRQRAVERAIVRDNCLMQGLPECSPLETSVRAGLLGLPSLLKLSGVLRMTGGDLSSLTECVRDRLRHFVLQALFAPPSNTRASRHPGLAVHVQGSHRGAAAGRPAVPLCVRVPREPRTDAARQPTDAPALWACGWPGSAGTPWRWFAVIALQVPNMSEAADRGRCDHVDALERPLWPATRHRRCLVYSCTLSLAENSYDSRARLLLTSMPGIDWPFEEASMRCSALQRTATPHSQYPLSTPSFLLYLHTTISSHSIGHSGQS